MSAERPYAEKASAYAEGLYKRFQAGILKSMQGKPLWGLYKVEQDEKGNWHKRPYQPNGRAASTLTLAHWNSLDTVLEALALAKFPVSGIGMLLPAPYILIDLDAKEDAPIYDKETKKIVSPLALRIMHAVPTYFELSPRLGLHGITEGRPRQGNFRTASLEMYTNWFSTVTTRHLPGTPLDVTNQQEAIEALEDEFHPKVSERVYQNTGGVAVASRLTELPPEAASHVRLQQLLSGDMSSVSNDHHLADWNALMMLLHWTGDDIPLTREIFLASTLGQRAKAWDEKGEGRRGQESYLDRTIRRILEKRRNPPMKR